MVKLIEILDTAVKIGLGAFIAGWLSIYLEKLKKKTEYFKELERRHHEEIKKPIILFVDEMLILMSKAYWEKAEGKEPNTYNLLETFRQKEAMIEARILSINNENISKSFKDLTHAYAKF